MLRLWRPGRGAQVVLRSKTTTVGRGLVGSGRLLAFERSYPGCPTQPGVACPTLTDFALGPRTGPFHPITAAWKCAFPFSEPGLDLAASFVAYNAIDCERERVTTYLQTTSAPPKKAVLRNVPLRDACCAGLRLAGRFIAWSTDWNGRVDVLDRDRNRVVASARIEGGREKPVSFDVQDDGTLAVIAPGGRLAYGHVGDVVVSDLRGRRRFVARFRPPAFLHRALDFDGTRLVFASDVITRTWVDCPPPGQERPCVKRESGTTTIWAARAPGFAPKRVARFAFEGISGSSR